MTGYTAGETTVHKTIAGIAQVTRASVSYTHLTLPTM